MTCRDVHCYIVNEGVLFRITAFLKYSFLISNRRNYVTTRVILLIVPRTMDKKGATLLRQLSLAVDWQSDVGSHAPYVKRPFLYSPHLQWLSIKHLKAVNE